MANLKRSAKLGNEWTGNDLAAYHITVVAKTKQQFFHMPYLPSHTHPSLVNFMNATQQDNMADDELKKLLHFLNIALQPEPGGSEAAVINLVAKLMEKLGYNNHCRIIFIHHPFSLGICRISLSTHIDICVINDRHEPLMLVLNKKSVTMKDPEPEVIAGAIAAYAAIANNQLRDRQSIPPLPAITIPAITMIGTCPIFYKIPVTAELCDAVRSGRYPAIKTLVPRYIPVFSGPQTVAMRSPQNRVEILACLQAFKQFL